MASPRAGSTWCVPAIVAATTLASVGVDANASTEREGRPASSGVRPAGPVIPPLSELLGADRYYEHTPAIVGQGTITANHGGGHFWNGHESLQHVAMNTTNFVSDPMHDWSVESVSRKFDRHATWVAVLLGGRAVSEDPLGIQRGIAHGTDLRSWAIMSAWEGEAYTLSGAESATTLIRPFQGIFGDADVVNDSSGSPDPAGVSFATIIRDSFCFDHPTTTLVISSGDNGKPVTGPGSGFNGITVGWLTAASRYDAVSPHSGQSPQAFGYLDKNGTPVIKPGIRAAVDITAPGDELTSGFYGGQTGGNGRSLKGSKDEGTDPKAFSRALYGTSFSAPLVAGGASLMASAARIVPSLSGNPDATQSVVIKALLLNGATKTTDWDNGQRTVTVDDATYVTTTQSVDWAAGTGRMDLDRTFDLQTAGETDVSGTTTGDLGKVARLGWDYGAAEVGGDNDYVIAGELVAGTTITTTLVWMRNRSFHYTGPSPPGPPVQVSDVAQADLNLSIWTVDDAGRFDTLIARSESVCNTVEHLVVRLPKAGTYGLRVEYPRNTFDHTDQGTWGTTGSLQNYGLAWQAEHAAK